MAGAGALVAPVVYQEDVMPTGGPGRKRALRGSGAGRKVVLLRVPVEIAAEVDARAAQLGVSANEAWTRAGAEWVLRQTHREHSE